MKKIWWHCRCWWWCKHVGYCGWNALSYWRGLSEAFEIYRQDENTPWGAVMEDLSYAD